MMESPFPDLTPQVPDIDLYCDGLLFELIWTKKLMLHTRTILQRTRAGSDLLETHHYVIVRPKLSFSLLRPKILFQIVVPILSWTSQCSAQQCVGADRPGLTARKDV